MVLDPIRLAGELGRVVLQQRCSCCPERIVLHHCHCACCVRRGLDVLLCFVVCVAVSRKDKISIFGQLDRTNVHVRTPDRFSINIAIKQEQRKHNVDHNDDDIDNDDGVDALNATVNEERVKVYGPV